MDITNTICPVPWMHLAFEPSGKVIPCCLTSVHNYFAGDLNTHTVDEIWNSHNMKELRRQMINGIEPKVCNKCFDRERVTGESSRTYRSNEFPDVIKKIPEITLADGTCTEMDLKYWDFRFSNLCNMKCRSCGQRYSSAWVPDAKKLGYDKQDKVWNIEQVDSNTNYEFLKDQIKNVKRIYFAGGEPLLMPEHWQILDMLVEGNRFDVKLVYNTNCSVFTYNNKHILDYWKKWRLGSLDVCPSIDEIGERAELIRSGTVWSKVEANLKELAKQKNIVLRPSITAGAWNVHRLPEIIQYLTDIGVIKTYRNYEHLGYTNFFINLLQNPPHYHVSILPDDYRAKVTEKLKTFIDEYNTRYNSKIDRLFTYILHELSKPFDLESAKTFLFITGKLDEIRKENMFKTVPEMKVVRDAVNAALREQYGSEASE